ncbi:hypothetical protein [Candidatus Methylacidiphilum infernorum]|uniref:hypothetical protein n=1 Tax=Candidatus Methylacidiphilum infernorum TaxID=511746 RepID=UPI0002D9B411|nr:hypothetical protein [Candidatus Methylacidiphilum infernorum]
MILAASTLCLGAATASALAIAGLGFAVWSYYQKKKRRAFIVFFLSALLSLIANLFC